jgi:hypothetical protein
MDGQTSKCKFYVRLYDLLICVLLLSKANQHLHALQLLITPFFVKKKMHKLFPSLKQLLSSTINSALPGGDYDVKEGFRG